MMFFSLRRYNLCMPFRNPKHEVLRRARTSEEKAQVKASLIATGRKLVATEGLAAVSLRRVATEAGYAPSTIYKYFRDQQDLFFQIRAEDMHAANAMFRRHIARTHEPAARVKKLFIVTAEYWLAHMDDFMVIFAPPGERAAEDDFAKSDAVRDALALYYETVDALFDVMPRPALTSRAAADLLLAAVHGTVLFPHMTPGISWTPRKALVARLVTTMVDSWVEGGK